MIVLCQELGTCSKYSFLTHLFRRRPSSFIPVDGVAFQWVMCISIWCVGLILQMVKERTADQKFYAYAMIGGALWCTGNMCVVPVIKTIVSLEFH